MEALDRFDLQQGQDAKDRLASHPTLWRTLVDVDQARGSNHVATALSTSVQVNLQVCYCQ